MKGFFSTFSLALMLIFSCNNSTGNNLPLKSDTMHSTGISRNKESYGGRQFSGPFSNGMKGDSIFFNISADGKKLENLTFKGYWRCSGKLESISVGPEGIFTLENGKVNNHITEPPNGGSTAWRFDLEADINHKKASGTFRMNINNLGCDTYKLKWTAEAK